MSAAIDFTELDTWCASIVRLTDQHVDPVLRLQVLADQVCAPEFELLGFDSRRIQSYVLPRLCSDRENIYRTDVACVRSVVSKALSAASYALLSYWSPLDSRRRTVCIRKRDLSASPHAAAYAYSAHALTLEGWRQTPPVTSYGQHIAEFSEIKRGITMTYREADHRPGELYLAPVFAKLPVLLGVKDAIDRELLRCSPYELNDAIASMFLNIPKQRWPRLRGVPTTLLKRVESNARQLDSSVLEELDELRPILSAHICDDNQTLERSQVLAMVLIESLWRAAFGEQHVQYVNVFPTLCGDTCCFLTVGSAGRLSTEEHTQIATLSRILFTNTLLLEYRQSAIEDTQSRHNNVFRRLLGHNFPKFFVKPGLNELSCIEEHLRETPVFALDVKEALDRVQRLKVLFAHYENFVLAIMSAETLQEDFKRRGKHFDLITAVIPKVKTLFEYLRSVAPSTLSQKYLHLDCEVPEGCEMIGNESFVTELLFNLVSNAVDAVDPKGLEEHPARAQLDLTIRRGETYGPDRYEILIRLQDHGVGFRPEQLKAYELLVKSIQESTAKGFWSNLLANLDGAVREHSREGHFGIGLIFCTAYLRSLEWNDSILRPGKLEIYSTSGEGTTVTVTLPGGCPTLS